jgi:hypothetical protein
MAPEIWSRFRQTAKTAIGSPMLENMGLAGIHFFRSLCHNSGTGWLLDESDHPPSLTGLAWLLWAGGKLGTYK